MRDATPWRRSPYVSASTSASHEASMMLAPTPTVTHESLPSVVSISTRVMASVPCPWSRMRTRKSIRWNRATSGIDLLDRLPQRVVERVDRTVALADDGEPHAPGA